MRCEQPGFGSSYRGPRSRGRFKTRRDRVASGRRGHRDRRLEPRPPSHCGGAVAPRSPDRARRGARKCGGPEARRFGGPPGARIRVLVGETVLRPFRALRMFARADRLKDRILNELYG